MGISGKEVYVAKINFRESFIKPYDELWNQGYLDIKTPFLLSNVAGTFRMSNYLPDEEVGQLIMRLRQYYDVGFEEAIYYVDTRMFYFNCVKDEKAIVRIFPLEDYCKIDPDIKMKEYKYGILYIREENEFRPVEIDAAFDYIPDESNTSVRYTKEPHSIKVKPVNPDWFEDK